MHCTFILVVCSVWVPAAYSYRDFKADIPNGNNVPNPCVANTKWKAPGHNNILGGGARNSFGEDFDQAGRTWTVELCQKDSDGDGKSNGVELGDPNCVWAKGGPPPAVILLNSLSHPGICEPMESAQCEGKNKEGICDQKSEFNCNFNANGVDNDVFSPTLRLDETEIPSKETTYICQSFYVSDFIDDSSKPYHIIGSEPVLANPNIVHHMAIFGCKENGEINRHFEQLRTPGECIMTAATGCSIHLAGWTVGSLGSCIAGDYGFKIGPGLIERFIIQIHWNNPLLHENQVDSSGMKLYLTPNLRSADLASMVVGPLNLKLEPGQSRVDQTGVCSSKCTEELFGNREINVIGATNHMHYLGIEGHLEVLRDGQVIDELAVDENFEYDTPTGHGHNPPLVIRPGDEIRMKCVYNTLSQSNTVYYGEGTQAEMCFGFLSFYPGDINPAGRIQCLTWDGGLDSCQLQEQMTADGCNAMAFFRTRSTYRKLRQVNNICQLDTCTPACLQLLLSWYEEEVCLGHRSIRHYILSIMYALLDDRSSSLMRSCDAEYNKLFTTTTTSAAPVYADSEYTNSEENSEDLNTASDSSMILLFNKSYILLSILFTLIQ